MVWLGVFIAERERGKEFSRILEGGLDKIEKVATTGLKSVQQTIVLLAVRVTLHKSSALLLSWSDSSLMEPV